MYTHATTNLSFLGEREEVAVDMSTNKPCYKVILLGNLSVGKTSLFRKLKGERKSHAGKEDKLTESIELRPYTLEFKLDNGATVQLEINDTNSTERFRSTIPTNYYRHCHGVVLMYDITDSVSLYNLEEWMTEVEERATEDRIIYTMIGNRLDQIDDKKDLLDGNIYRERLDIPENLHFLLSIRNETTQNLRQIFKVLAHAIHEAQEGRERHTDGETTVLLTQRRPEKQSSCCSLSYS